MKIKFKIFITYLISFSLTAGIVFLLYFFDILNIDFEKNTILLIISVSVIFLFPFILSILITSDISKNIQQIISFLNQFFIDKKLADKIEEKSKRKDEFGTVFKKISDIYSSYQSYLKFADNLKKGIKADTSELDNKEVLAAAMIDIQENLITAAKEQKYNQKESERNKWYQSGINDFTLLLQQDFRSTQEMAYPVIKKLAEHLAVEQIGIFVLTKKNDKELLVLEAAYAYDKKKQLDTEVEIGESLVGKCAKEQKLIRIDDLPEGYTYIGSGLGEDTPKSLILLPLLHEKKLFGVLEIASLKRIPDNNINFLNVIAERISAEISNINTKILTAKLTEDYKKQSEELALKEKKSEQIISELIKEKETNITEQKKLSEKINLINDNIPTVIFDYEGIPSEINKAAEELYGIKKETGLTESSEKKFPYNDKFREILKKVLEGETIILRYFRNNKTEEVIEKYIPYKNSENKIDSVILTAIKIKIH